MVSIKFLSNIDSLHVICYTLLVAVTWLSGLLSLDTKLQAKLFWVDNNVSGSKEEGLVEIVMLFIPPKRSLGGYIGVTRWSVGWSGGRSVGPAVRCVFLFQYNFIQ